MQQENKTGKIIVMGRQVDNETRCVHYHSPLDIIAIRFKCCDQYYPCYDCHQDCADHPVEVWKMQEFNRLAILCGNCKTEMSIEAYKNRGDHCPFCNAAFNPGCLKHHSLYFE